MKAILLEDVALPYLDPKAQTFLADYRAELTPQLRYSPMSRQKKSEFKK
jgi:hypothetical protein